ncbi:hypothetical protein [Dyadobacter sp. BHUBP1]|uniref:hypothetical protein n=1 Tax=Dyadobacter sp. BHUBP1 TaxID=3424178 RepID=UPI003D35365B
MVRFEIGGTSIAVRPEREPVRIYEDDDDTEDYYMLAKEPVDKMGLGPIVERLSFGQARFGERIFD